MGVQATQHQNDALDRIVILLEAEFTQARPSRELKLKFLRQSPPVQGLSDY
jgi:hypothetical protein